MSIELERDNECVEDGDSGSQQAGQVGSQIKIRVGAGWLLASVRDQRKDRRANGGILASIDFLGEGVEEKLTGRLHGFRSEEHTSELQSLMRISYAVFCLKKKTQQTN